MVLLALIALIPAKIAAKKGHSFWLWYAFAIAFWIVALPAALIVKDTRPTCPYCAEPVRAEASVCPHCHREMQPNMTLQRDWSQQYAGILDDHRNQGRPVNVCARCAASLEPDDRFCRQCGAPMSLANAQSLF
jgi:predicted amidophosphoribosyltransferase